MKHLEFERDVDEIHPPVEARTPIRILLVNNYPLVRTGLRMLIESWPGFTVFGEAGLCEEAIRLACVEKAEIVLLGADGCSDSLAFLRLMADGAPDARIIFLADTHDRQLNQKALLEGAMGVVQLEKAGDELRKSIACVHAGELWMDRSTTANLIADMARAESRLAPQSAEAKIESLTDREREVALLVCEGLKNEEIGTRLGISQTTARHHISSILGKIAVTNRLELIIFLYRHKFVRTARSASSVR
jgi:DNA-binding NarL/FixJ family response regulator